MQQRRVGRTDGPGFAHSVLEVLLFRRLVDLVPELCLELVVIIVIVIVGIVVGSLVGSSSSGGESARIPERGNRRAAATATGSRAPAAAESRGERRAVALAAGANLVVDAARSRR